MKILIVRVSSLGDVVHNMPMVADLLRRYPGAQIDWVVEEAYVNLIRLNRGVSEVIPFALRRWRKSLHKAATRAEVGAFFKRLRAQSYDLVFDTQGLLKTGILMGCARTLPGGRRIGLANGTEGSGYEGISRLFHTESIRVPQRCHAVERARLVAAAAGGYAIDTPADFDMRDPDGAPDWLPKQPYAVFFHATARAAKQWSAQGWIALAELLAARHMPVLLPWGDAKEEAAAHTLAAHMPNATVLPRLSMMEAVLLARRAALAVGVDTGLTHIAAAYCRPTLELYCDSPRWKTEGNWSSAVMNLGDQGQPPAFAEVAAAVELLLNQASDQASNQALIQATDQATDQSSTTA